MDMNLVTIAKYSDSIEAERSKSYLEEAGFAVYLVNERFSSNFPSMAGSMYQMELKVPKESEEAAKALLTALDDANATNAILQAEAALLEGHFLLTSGKHSDRYIEKIRVLQNPKATHALCALLSKRLAKFDFDTVIGPAYGGIVLAYEVASILGKNFIFCQRKDGQMSFRSGFDLRKVQKAVLIEDILSTGGSISEVLKSLQDERIETVAIGLLVDRSGGKLDFGIPIEALLSIEVPLWEPDSCNLCREGIPLTRPGSSDKPL
ncbi:MAG: orotate phosphoribosyltransferase [Candidatus Cloacimonetes bacterium]|nr:orotate phosphoribosyltransferase [Candidatus Cloacimonadota bacterium]